VVVQWASATFDTGRTCSSRTRCDASGTSPHGGAFAASSWNTMTDPRGRNTGGYGRTAALHPRRARGSRASLSDGLSACLYPDENTRDGRLGC